MFRSQKMPEQNQELHEMTDTCGEAHAKSAAPEYASSFCPVPTRREQVIEHPVERKPAKIMYILFSPYWTVKR